MRKPFEKHGLTGTKIERAWRSMMSRCYHKKNVGYAYYGGRGIVVCERWKLSIAAFHEDVGPPPSDKHSIDRIDCNGNYEPNNVRWADWKEQMRNRRCNRLVYCDGRRAPLAQIAEESGISPVTLGSRLRSGWTTQSAVHTPTKPKHLLTFGGVTKPLGTWARELGIPETTIHNRLKRGWSADRALRTKSRKFKTLTWDGKTLTIPEWAKLIGIDRSSLRDRLARGWSIERSLTTPPR